jgi:hypothetical protein
MSAPTANTHKSRAKRVDSRRHADLQQYNRLSYCQAIDRNRRWFERFNTFSVFIKAGTSNYGCIVISRITWQTTPMRLITLDEWERHSSETRRRWGEYFERRRFIRCIA